MATVITIVNYNHRSFIVQVTGAFAVKRLQLQMTPLVIRMMIVRDATTWSITYDQHCRR
jgi:hypothetical protein